MRMHLWRITGVVGVCAALLGSASVGMAAQRPAATSATVPVIVFLKSQLAAAPAGTKAFSRRMAESSADQASVIAAAAARGAKNVRQYQLVDSFAATVSPQALTELAASPDVAEGIPDVTIRADLGGADPAPAPLTSPTSQKKHSDSGPTPNVIPGPCPRRANGQRVPEGLSLTGTASDDASQPTAR